jgi:hypothetical protein
MDHVRANLRIKLRRFSNSLSSDERILLGSMMEAAGETWGAQGEMVGHAGEVIGDGVGERRRETDEPLPVDPAADADLEIEEGDESDEGDAPD